MFEREQLPDEDVLFRHEVLNRRPDTRPIFEELNPLAQEYIHLEYAISRPDLERDEKKILSVQLERKSRLMFGNNPQADQMREDVTRYGQAIWQELQGVNKR